MPGLVAQAWSFVSRHSRETPQADVLCVCDCQVGSTLLCHPEVTTSYQVSKHPPKQSCIYLLAIPKTIFLCTPSTALRIGGFGGEQGRPPNGGWGNAPEKEKMNNHPQIHLVTSSRQELFSLPKKHLSFAPDIAPLTTLILSLRIAPCPL
jgi:hypothetical protein